MVTPAPFQILAIPFRQKDKSIEVLLLKRIKPSFWQFVTGGNEEDETAPQTAIREILEETGFKNVELIPLDTCNSLPSRLFKHYQDGKSPYVIKEFCFAFKVPLESPVVISNEHSNCNWTSIAKAKNLLSFDGDRTALWELEQRLQNNDTKDLGS